MDANKIRAGVLLASALLLISASTLQAQTCAPGELRVFVLDTEQAPVFDAHVKITSESGSPVEHTTQSSGITDFEGVPCGIWSALATKEGFEPAAQTVQVTN